MSCIEKPFIYDDYIIIRQAYDRMFNMLNFTTDLYRIYLSISVI